MPRKCNVSPAQWDHAADLFELGFKNGCQLADDLGVSPSTVRRAMERRGARKGSRAHETVVELEAFLDRKQRRAAHMRAVAEHSVAARRAAGVVAVGRMIDAILAADSLGDLGLADAVIDQTAAAFGASVPKRSRRR